LPALFSPNTSGGPAGRRFSAFCRCSPEQSWPQPSELAPLKYLSRPRAKPKRDGRCGQPAGQPPVGFRDRFSLRVSGHSDPAVPLRHRPSCSYAHQNARFAQESSFHFWAIAYLYAASYFSGIALRKQAGIDTPRIAVGTVPGTVPGATSEETPTGVCGRFSPAILRPVRSATCGPFRKVTRRWTLAAIGNPTFRPIGIVTRRLIRGVTYRGTFGATSAAVSTAARGPRKKERRSGTHRASA
jgi:hypothetical protein